jgi:hypothetical protein
MEVQATNWPDAIATPYTLPDRVCLDKGTAEDTPAHTAFRLTPLTMVS